MSEFAIIYHAGDMPSSPEDGAAHQQRWTEWVKGLGDTVVNPGTPFGPSKIVSRGGVQDSGADRINGYAVVKAENLDAAIEIAKSDPFLQFGDVQVAEIMQMG